MNHKHASSYDSSFVEHFTRRGPEACSYALHMALLFSGNPTAKIERTTEQSRNLRENRGSFGAGSQQIDEFHVLPGNIYPYFLRQSKLSNFLFRKKLSKPFRWKLNDCVTQKSVKISCLKLISSPSASSSTCLQFLMSSRT